MADLKISDLPAAGVLAGGELMAVVQGGATKKAAVSSLAPAFGVSTNTPNTLVLRDGSGNFVAGTITAALTGNASTATTLATARTINGTSFNGSADITVTAAASTLTGTTLASGVTASSLTSVGTLTALTVAGTIKLQQVLEKATVSATAATGTINYDALTQAVLFYTSNASGNWTLNVRGSSGATLDSILAVGESITLTFLVTQGATPYYATAHQIDGNAVTPKWQGGTAPTAGNASSIDVYTYVIIKTAATPTFTVLASVTKFA